ncbi:hypothetical protein BGZ65_010348, partial [Modicella reniformis]
TPLHGCTTKSLQHAQGVEHFEFVRLRWNLDLRVLASCPLLENLAADRVPARFIMYGQSWTCSGRLKKLRVFFELSDDPLEVMQQQEDILDRLRCLVYLD